MRSQSREEQLQHSHLVDALENLRDAYDYRRAALAARQAQKIPVEVLLILFQRYRSALIQHFADRLEDGTDQLDLMPSLQQLLQNLGAPDHEADYIVIEARRLLPSETVLFEREHRQRVGDIDETYRVRMKVLDDTVGDEELRTRLHEAEQTRFRNELLEIAEPKEEILPQLDVPFVPPSLDERNVDDESQENQ